MDAKITSDLFKKLNFPELPKYKVNVLIYLLPLSNNSDEKINCFIITKNENENFFYIYQTITNEKIKLIWGDLYGQTLINIISLEYKNIVGQIQSGIDINKIEPIYNDSKFTKTLSFSTDINTALINIVKMNCYFHDFVETNDSKNNKDYIKINSKYLNKIYIKE